MTDESNSASIEPQETPHAREQQLLSNLLVKDGYVASLKQDANIYARLGELNYNATDLGQLHGDRELHDRMTLLQYVAGYGTPKMLGDIFDVIGRHAIDDEMQQIKWHDAFLTAMESGNLSNLDWFVTKALDLKIVKELVTSRIRYFEKHGWPTDEDGQSMQESMDEWMSRNLEKFPPLAYVLNNDSFAKDPKDFETEEGRRKLILLGYPEINHVSWPDALISEDLAEEFGITRRAESKSPLEIISNHDDPSPIYLIQEGYHSPLLFSEPDHESERMDALRGVRRQHDFAEDDSKRSPLIRTRLEEWRRRIQAQRDEPGEALNL